MIRRLLDRYFIKQPRLRQLVTRTVEADKDSTIRIFGTPLRINSLKEHGYLRASRKLDYHSALRDEAGVLLTLALIIDRGDTFIDVGANVGLFACTIARRRTLRGDILVYAFEANPDTYLRLIASCEGTDVVTQHLAVSDHVGELEFIAGAVSHVFAQADHRNPYHFSKQTPVRVRANRLDALGLPGDSLVIKVDVEGAEMQVLRGAERLFDEDRVKAVYFDGFGDSGVVDFLRQRGFLFYDARDSQPVEQPVFSLLALKVSKCL